MKWELTEDFIEQSRKLPERIRKTGSNNRELWKKNPYHPSLEFKPARATRDIYSVRVGLWWRALGAMKEQDYALVWFWIGSHSEFEELIKLH